MHYIGMAGLHGCMPQTCGAYDTAEAAAESLGDTHDLGRKRRAELWRDWSIELNLKRDGNEYAEISECDCDDPESHNDC